MARTLSSTGYAAVTAAQTEAVFCHLLEISTNDSPVTTIRICDNSESVDYGGNTYSPFPFQITLPSDENGQITEARLIIDNISRILVDEIRSVENPLSIAIYVIDVTQTPVVLEASFDGFVLKNIAYDIFTIEGKLTIEDYIGEPFPKDILSAAKYPGLF